MCNNCPFSLKVFCFVKMYFIPLILHKILINFESQFFSSISSAFCYFLYISLFKTEENASNVCFYFNKKVPWGTILLRIRYTEYYIIVLRYRKIIWTITYFIDKIRIIVFWKMFYLRFSALDNISNFNWKFYKIILNFRYSKKWGIVWEL